MDHKIDRKFPTAWRVTTLAIAAGIGIVLLSGFVGAAYAGDDEEEGETFDTKIMKDVLRGIGLRDGSEKSINYHERSPLVVPPSRDLPPPATSASVDNNAAWPDDKDALNNPKRKKKKSAATNWGDDPRSVSLNPQELEVGRGNSRDVNGPDRQSQVLTPTELGYKGNLWSLDSFLGKNDLEQKKFTSEPPRASLIEPPTGYRTPAANQPYGANTRDQIKSLSAEERFEEAIGNR